MAFDPDGEFLLTGSRDGTAQLWDVATCEPHGEALHHEGSVIAVAFSPDGQTMFTASEDKTVRLWDVATGELRGAPLRHHGKISDMALSADGTTLLTSQDGDTAKLWEILPPFSDEPERIRCWVELQTGKVLEANLALRPRSYLDWLARWKRLDELGGPPISPRRR